MSIHDSIRDLRAVIGTRPINLIGAGAVITDAHGHVLLCRRVGGRAWGVPTGISELGEALDATMRREVREETGLHVHTADLLDVVSGPDTYRRLANDHEFYAYTALCRVTVWSGNPQPDGVEIAELSFFAPDGLPPLGGPVTRRAVQVRA
ncbi:NUDIX domain-containing protein [uncultured Deinococcus sp.]|uniref:NUDIX hydrolase n=1 Tax=uncultured Deinococcus sp. TaxID=158789 RepID=UPI0025D68E05|nr:NUDIX domain-containing protein [uncultured Deinococcus sp.]